MSAAHVCENESVQVAEQPAGVGAPDIGAPRSAVPALSALCPRSVPALSPQRLPNHGASPSDPSVPEVEPAHLATGACARPWPRAAPASSQALARAPRALSHFSSSFPRKSDL